MVAKLDISVAGCGIGGLAIATLLSRSGHTVTLIDKFAEPEPVGSGLVIQPVGQAVLKELNAWDEAKRSGREIQHLSGRVAPNDRLVLDATYGKRAGLAIHRASLFNALFRQAHAAGITFVGSTEVVSSKLEVGKRVLQTSSGRWLEPFDLVVDATGAHSRLSPAVNRALPFGALWANVDWPRNTALPKDTLSQKYWKSEIMAGVLPIGRMPGSETEKAAIFWSLPRLQYPHWQQSSLADWQDQTISHWPEYAPFVRQLSRHDDWTMASYTHGLLRNPVAERLAHIGDPAHTASPQLGQGANMALLDAYALAIALGRYPLETGLEIYRLSRRNHTRIYQAASRFFTPLYQSESRVLPVLRDQILAPVTRLPLAQRILTRLVAGDLVPPIQAGLTHRAE